jgi:hypothetical protein
MSALVSGATVSALDENLPTPSPAIEFLGLVQ